MMQWVRAALLVCAMVWFVSCSTNESPVASDQAYDAAEELARETFYNDTYNVIQRVKTLAPSATVPAYCPSIFLPTLGPMTGSSPQLRTMSAVFSTFSIGVK